MGEIGKLLKEIEEAEKDEPKLTLAVIRKKYKGKKSTFPSCRSLNAPLWRRRWNWIGNSPICVIGQVKKLRMM